MERHPPAYLSPSRLSTYEYCPAEFRKRYVLKQSDPPTPEMAFGTAVHAGIEAHYLGKDDDLAFLKSWRDAQKIIPATVRVFGSGLTDRGLQMLEMVRNLGLSGTPEKHFIMVAPGFIIPILGYIDLWSKDHLYDFKTTGYSWTQTKADAQMFQPAIYSQAYLAETGTLPKFTFVVMSRITGSLALIDGTRSAAQIGQAFDRAREIHNLIEAKVFDCTCTRHEAVAA